MILKKDVHHPNDVSFKYLEVTEAEEMHSYFKLPGKYVRNFPTKIVKRDGSEREMDWLILVDPDNKTIFTRTLINVEFQTKKVDSQKIKTIADYRDYTKTYFGLPVLTIIIITDEQEYKKSVKEYEITQSDILRPIYIHMPWKEIKKRFNNLKRKIVNYEKLTSQESFDIAFLPMFAPKQKAKSICEKITQLFKKDKTLKGTIRNDIAYVLGIMIRKYFDATEKGKELLKLIEKEITKTALMDVIEYELDYRDQAHKAEIKEKNKQISDKEKQISEKNKQITEKNKQITDKEKQISEKNKQITDKEKQISEKNKQISEINNENAKLKAKLKENGITY